MPIGLNSKANSEKKGSKNIGKIMLSRDVIFKLHEQNNGKICYIEDLCVNDDRMVLRNEDEILYVFMDSPHNIELQAHVARLCQAINSGRKHYLAKKV